MIFSGSVIESTTLPITLILSNANYQMQLVIVVDSISFQLPMAQLPISGGRTIGSRCPCSCWRWVWAWTSGRRGRRGSGWSSPSWRWSWDAPCGWSGAGGECGWLVAASGAVASWAAFCLLLLVVWLACSRRICSYLRVFSKGDNKWVKEVKMTLKLSGNLWLLVSLSPSVFGLSLRFLVNEIKIDSGNDPEWSRRIWKNIK